MKQPSLKNVKIDLKATEKMRIKMAKVKKIKITINIDEDLLSALKLRSNQSGIPYQNLLNRVLRAAIQNQSLKEDTRLDRLEKEVASLKKRLSA